MPTSVPAPNTMGGSSNTFPGWVSLKFPVFVAAQPQPEPQARNPRDTVGYKRWTTQGQGDVGSAAGVLSSPQVPGKKHKIKTLLSHRSIFLNIEHQQLNVNGAAFSSMNLGRV